MNYIFSKRWAPTSLWPASGRTVCSAPRTGTRSLACSKRRAAVFFNKMYDFDLYPIRICDYQIPAVLTSFAEPDPFGAGTFCRSRSRLRNTGIDITMSSYKNMQMFKYDIPMAVLWSRSNFDPAPVPATGSRLASGSGSGYPNFCNTNLSKKCSFEN